MPTPLILIGVPFEALRTEEATLTGDIFALPARHCVLNWQVVIASAEDVTVTLSTAIDPAGPWLVVDTITLTGSEESELRVVDPAAGLLGRLDVTVNASEILVVGTIVAKVAVP